MSAEGSKEEEEAVDMILKCKTHFELLQVSLDAPEDVLKKQYKKLALTIHPDKNQSPRADEAFKLLRAAFECLSDILKRSDYMKSLQGISGDRNKKRSHSPDLDETSEERKKRKEKEREEEILKKEAEAEKRREWAEAYCDASAERMDNQRKSWMNFQQKKKKR